MFYFQIRTEEMDLIAERGIAAHYSGRGFVTGLVGHVMPNSRGSRGKAVCLNNANIALRVWHGVSSFLPYYGILLLFFGVSFRQTLEASTWWCQVCKWIVSFSFQIGWLNAIREWQEEFVGNMSSREFVDTVTRDLLGSRVFVFTPRGEVRNLTDFDVKIALLEAVNFVLLLFTD